MLWSLILRTGMLLIGWVLMGGKDFGAFFYDGPMLLCHPCSVTVLHANVAQLCSSLRGFAQHGVCQSSAIQEWPRQTKPKKGPFMNFSQGRSGTKVQCESCLFSQGKNTIIHKNGRNS